MSSGESRRRAEIEAKRAKLAELKRAREERTSRLQAQQRGESVSESHTPSSRKDLDDFVATLVGSGSKRSGESSIAGSAIPSSPRNGGAATSEYGGSEGMSVGTTLVTRGDGEVVNTENDVMMSRSVPDMVDVETELFEFPQRERVYYTKEVQTTAPDSDSDDGSGQAKTAAATEEAIRSRILKEQEVEREKLEESKREEERLEKEIEEDLRELTEEERAAIYGATDFTEFVEQSSKIVQRALTDAYDYMKDYTIGGEGVGDDNEGRQVKCVRTFWDERLLKNRSITDIDWSTKHPELSVASYNRNEMATNDPDGIVAVWNMHLLERPEFVFHAQTDVLSVSFSPFHNNLIIGGTYSGQILIWDTRARALPVLKTPLSAAGHTHPVYAMQMVGTQNAHNLMTASTDGTVCSWMLDMLARPQETLELLNQNHPKTDEVSVTTLSFPDNETTSFWVGTEEGNIYSAARYDRAGAKAGLSAHEVYRAHAAPVTRVHFHPLAGPVDFSDLFLSSSMDWTTRLWRARSSATPRIGPQSGPTPFTPIHSFEEAGDYVYDVKWHPQHPAMFGSVDGTGRFDLYNLNIDTERPTISTTVGNSRALNKLSWDRRDGRRAAMGGADGRLYVYDIGDLAVPADNEWLELQKTVARMLQEQQDSSNASGSGAGAAMQSAASGGIGADGAPGQVRNSEFERYTQRLAVK